MFGSHYPLTTFPDVYTFYPILLSYCNGSDFQDDVEQELCERAAFPALQGNLGGKHLVC